MADADLEAAVLVSKSDYEVPSGSPELDAYPGLRNPTTSVLVGSPVSDIAFSKPVRMEFDIPLSGLVFTVNASGDVLPIPACAEGYGGAVPLLQEAPDAWPPGDVRSARVRVRRLCLDAALFSVRRGLPVLGRL